MKSGKEQFVNGPRYNLDEYRCSVCALEFKGKANNKEEQLKEL